MLLLWIAATHYEPTSGMITSKPRKPDNTRRRIMQDDDWLILHIATKKP